MSYHFGWPTLSASSSHCVVRRDCPSIDDLPLACEQQNGKAQAWLHGLLLTEAWSLSHIIDSNLQMLAIFVRLTLRQL